MDSKAPLSNISVESKPSTDSKVLSAHSLSAPDLVPLSFTYTSMPKPTPMLGRCEFLTTQCLSGKKSIQSRSIKIENNRIQSIFLCHVNAALPTHTVTNYAISTLEFEIACGTFNFIDELVLPPNHCKHNTCLHHYEFICKLVSNVLKNGADSTKIISVEVK